MLTRRTFLGLLSAALLTVQLEATAPAVTASVAPQEMPEPVDRLSVGDVVHITLPEIDPRTRRSTGRQRPRQFIVTAVADANGQSARLTLRPRGRW